MAKLKFFFDGQPCKVVRNIKRLIYIFNNYRLSDSVLLDLALEEKNEDFERYMLKINDPRREPDGMARIYGIDNLAGIFVLLPHADRTMIEFHSTDRIALGFWDELIKG